MKNKEILLKAIEKFDEFSKSQKALLSIVLEFAEADMANISISSITEMSGYSKTIIFKNLIKLEKLGLISREKINQEKVGLIKINISAFQKIIDFYIKKQKFLPKTFIKN